ncbi:hypothetical protein CJ030_MR3G015847 [Morella rubra]|uniref:GRF-type domain-containing protein n=1 Tax=Morella rubra TaxID=262757 RepID=A0A6A1W5Q7_9ROSI|nr:hypothetical protein CJ030_MR3G015847 [Morella rubra]
MAINPAAQPPPALFHAGRTSLSRPPLTTTTLLFSLPSHINRFSSLSILTDSFRYVFKMLLIHSFAKDEEAHGLLQAVGTHYNLAHFLFPRRNPPFLSGEVLSQWHHICKCSIILHFLVPGHILLINYNISVLWVVVIYSNIIHCFRLFVLVIYSRTIHYWLSASFSNSQSSARPCASSESSSTVGSGGQFRTPFCYCSVESCLKTSYTEQNFGRRFFTCVNYKQWRSCGFFHWYDQCVSMGVLRWLREKHKRLNMEVDSHAPMAQHGTANTTAKLELVISQLRSELETMKKKNHRDRNMCRRVLVLSWAFFSVVMLSTLLSGSSFDDSLALPQ